MLVINANIELIVLRVGNFLPWEIYRHINCHCLCLFALCIKLNGFSHFSLWSLLMFLLLKTCLDQAFPLFYVYFCHKNLEAGLLYFMVVNIIFQTHNLWLWDNQNLSSRLYWIVILNINTWWMRKILKKNNVLNKYQR